MKRTVVASALAASLLFTGLASANDALFASDNASAQVTFYNAAPSSGSDVLATAMVNNSPLAPTIDGIEEAKYATVNFKGEDYTLELAESGKNKNEVMLQVASNDGNTAFVSQAGTISLAELMNALIANPDLLEQMEGSNPVG